jgi:hypothetical protein
MPRVSGVLILFKKELHPFFHTAEKGSGIHSFPEETG